MSKGKKAAAVADAVGVLPAVCTVEEAKALLTAIVRAQPGDFLRFEEVDDEAGPRIETSVDLYKAREKGMLHLLRGVKCHPARVGGNSLTPAYLELELYDKLGALKELAKLEGWYKPEKHEHSGRLDLAGLSDEQLKAEAAKLGFTAETTEHAEKGQGGDVGTAPAPATAKAEEPKPAAKAKPGAAVKRRVL